MSDGRAAKAKVRPTIRIVTGLPRSGTSMLMQMVEAAGLPVLTDGRRPPDLSNPRGYYEFEPVKRLESDTSFLVAAVGRVVKIVAPLLTFLPPDYDYRILFVERELTQVLASQREMLAALAGPTGDPDERALERAFERSIRVAKDWIDRQAGARVCFVSHAETIESPERTARCVYRFLAAGWDSPGERAAVAGVENREERAVERMASVIDESLLHQDPRDRRRLRA